MRSGKTLDYAIARVYADYITTKNMTIKYNNELKMFVGWDGKRNYYGAQAWHVIVQAYSLV